MPDRIYNGPVPEVELILASGAELVRKGESVTVSEEEAASLDAQGDWLPVPSPAPVPPPVPPVEAPAPAPAI